MSQLLSALSPLIQLSNLLFVAALLGIIWQWARPSSRLGKYLARTSLLLLAAIAVLPLHHLLYQPLEDRFPVPPVPSNIAGIIVLGGTVDPQISEQRDRAAIAGRAERLTETLLLAQHHPDAKIVFTGGKWRASDTLSEADAAARYFIDRGIAADRVMRETKAGNTWQNALFTQALAQPKPEENWVLVTSAAHMPRSVGVFRKIGWAGIIPYPVDFRTLPEGYRWRLNVSHNLYKIDAAVRSWLSLLGYYLLDRIDEVFPAP
jgi:uncharacterized SAM-binding protein YcdF (DUF218 family)